MTGISEDERIPRYNFQTLRHPCIQTTILDCSQLIFSQTLVYLSWASVSCNKSSRQTCRLPASTAAKRGIFPSWKEKSKNKNEKDNLITKSGWYNFFSSIQQLKWNTWNCLILSAAKVCYSPKQFILIHLSNSMRTEIDIKKLQVQYFLWRIAQCHKFCK